MTTAPNMPLAMCVDMGAVEQWYSQMPALAAVKVYSRVSPGSMERMF